MMSDDNFSMQVITPPTGKTFIISIPKTRSTNTEMGRIRGTGHIIKYDLNENDKIIEK